MKHQNAGAVTSATTQGRMPLVSSPSIQEDNMDLFSLPYARNSLSSREGAKEAQPRAGSQLARVLDHIRASGSYGATAWELRQETGIKQASTMSARIKELVNKGLIEALPDDRRRKGEFTVKTTVYVAINK